MDKLQKIRAIYGKFINDQELKKCIILTILKMLKIISKFGKLPTIKKCKHFKN